MATGGGGGRVGSTGVSEEVHGDFGDKRGGVRGGQVDSSGLAANRQRGFGLRRNLNSRFEAPSMNEIRARQEAVVSNFLTFFQRKSTLVVELYVHCFYKLKPNKERIAKFIYQDLCPLPNLRQSIEDVQFHPVKMLLFIKCCSDQIRDELVARIQSPRGVVWTEYNVRVKGYSLDPGVKFIRLLGAGPQTDIEEIKRTFVQAGIGEVVQIKKGVLDPVNLPGCSDGDWELRVKISDLEKPIPSYVYRRDEGEIWSLVFEGRKFCCWKCGSPTHIGDKCVSQPRTFEEVFNPGEEAVDKPTWAAIVRSGRPVTEEHRSAVQNFEKQIREDNQRRDRIKKDLEEKEKLEEAESEKRRHNLQRERAAILNEAAATAKEMGESGAEGVSVGRDLMEVTEEGSGLEDPVTNEELLEAAGKAEEFGRRTRATVEQHLVWLRARNSSFILTDLGMFFWRLYAVPTFLAIEYKQMGAEDSEVGLNEEESMELVSDIEGDGFLASTPQQQRRVGRRKVVSENKCDDFSSDDFDNVSPISMNVSKIDTREFNSSYVDSSSQSDNVQASKKPKLSEEFDFPSVANPVLSTVVSAVGRVLSHGTVPEGLGATECSSTEPGEEGQGRTSPLIDRYQEGLDSEYWDDGEFKDVTTKRKRKVKIDDQQPAPVLKGPQLWTGDVRRIDLAGVGPGHGGPGLGAGGSKGGLPPGLRVVSERGEAGVPTENSFEVLSQQEPGVEAVVVAVDGGDAVIDGMEGGVDPDPNQQDGEGGAGPDNEALAATGVKMGAAAGKEGDLPSDDSMVMESISPGSPERC